MRPFAPDHQFSHWERDEVISWDCPEGGYADRQSVAPGEVIGFCISTTRRDQEVLIYREGHQRRLVASIPAANLELQPVNPDQPYANGYGGYTVQRPDHWAFEGSGLKKDDGFGCDETICGTAVDELDIDWRDGLPWPSGKDGVPLDWEILATSKIAMSINMSSVRAAWSAARARMAAARCSTPPPSSGPTASRPLSRSDGSPAT